MKAIDETYLDIEPGQYDMEKMSQLLYAFYALWDVIRAVEKDVDKAMAECDEYRKVGSIIVRKK